MDVHPFGKAVFFHAWLVNDWRMIIEEQFAQIRASELAKEAEITVGAIGEDSALAELEELCSTLGASLVSFAKDPGQFEFPTLDLLLRHSESHDGVCVIYTQRV